MERVLALSSLKTKLVNGKAVFTPSSMEDSFAIKLLDRFIRRVYKVRQSDRNRIIRQLVCLLKDSGNFHIIKFDIKDFYETVDFEKLIKKFQNDSILSPNCLKLLISIHEELKNKHDILGLPRGLSISPTLAELYLESLDKQLVSHPDIIYSSRYVDDIIVIVPEGKQCILESDIEPFINEMKLSLNGDKNYSNPSNSAEFNFLGYKIKVKKRKNNPNDVILTISQPKLNKIKSRIIKGLNDYKVNKDLSLLKRRIEFICKLKTVRKSSNGNLLAGISHNYRYVTDEFECLKSLDGFLCRQLENPRFGLSKEEQNKIKKISIYVNAKKGNIGKFTRKQTINIVRIWKNV